MKCFYNFFLGYDWKLPTFYKQRVLSTLLIQECGVSLQKKIYKSLHILERNKKKRKNKDIYFSDYQSTMCTCNVYCYSQLKRLWACLLRCSKEGGGGEGYAVVCSSILRLPVSMYVRKKCHCHILLYYFLIYNRYSSWKELNVINLSPLRDCSETIP